MKHTHIFRIERRTGSKFYPINIDLNYSGNRIRYYTGFRLPAFPASESSWNDETQRISEKGLVYQGNNIVGVDPKRKKTDTIAGVRRVNKKFDKVCTDLDEYFDNVKYVPSKQELTIKLDIILKVKIEEIEEVEEKEKPDISLWTMYKRYIAEASVSEGRRKHLKVTETHLKASKLFSDFESVTSETIVKFEKYLLSKNKSRNTTNQQVKIFRAFWNWSKLKLKKEGIILPYPFEDHVIISEAYGTPYYLSKRQRDDLYKCELDPPSDRLDRVRDLFIFQCYVGCRVGDLISFKKSNVQNNTLSYIARKTRDGRPVTTKVPLSAIALQIIEKYKDLPGDILLPVISDQKYNKYLRELFLSAKITHTVTVLENGKEVHKRVCDIVSSHLARRTFIGNLYGKTDSDVIASMSGHAPGSKAFARYHDIPENLKKSAINKL